MAVTRLIPLHVNKGKTIAQTMSDRVGYAANHDKTDGGELVTGYQCNPRIAETEFLLSKKQYIDITGREQGDENVIAYHTRQSFKPGEITPEDANRIGYELALSFTKRNHQFIVATHIDKRHIHNHIIFNSTTLDCTRKFRNFWGSSRTLRRISDGLCIENGLSIVENPKRGKDYGTWLGANKPVSSQEKLRRAIDAVLDGKPADMPAFIRAMEALGYEVKILSKAQFGKHLAFRSPDQKRFTRLRSLGDDYTDDAILERITGKRLVVKREIADEIPAVREAPKFSLIIDLQNCIKAKNSPGYEQWVKVFNVKQAAQTIIYLQDNKLTDYNKLEAKCTEAKNLFNDLNAQIKAKESRLNEITALQKHIGNYSRTRDVYAQYRQSGYSKKFFAEHERDIELHKTSKKAFDSLGLSKVPSMKTLQTEYATILAEKKKLYQSYRGAKENMQEVLLAKNNSDRLLNYAAAEKSRVKDSRQR